MHQLIEPSLHCYRLRHNIQERPRSVGTGKITFCAVCTVGYETALQAFAHRPGCDAEQMADDFVRALRAEQTPMSGPAT